MFASIVLVYFVLAVLSMVPEVPSADMLPTSFITLIVLAFFLLSVPIALVSVIAGCTAGLFAVVTAVLIQFFKEKSILNTSLGTVMAALIIFALTGVF